MIFIQFLGSGYAYFPKNILIDVDINDVDITYINYILETVFRIAFKKILANFPIPTLFVKFPILVPFSRLPAPGYGQPLARPTQTLKWSKISMSPECNSCKKIGDFFTKFAGCEK